MYTSLSLYMVESVNSPWIFDTFWHLNSWSVQLVSILGCTINFAYLKGTRRVPLRYPKSTVHPRILTSWTLQEFGCQKVPKIQGEFTDSTI